MTRGRAHESWKDRRITPSDEKDFLNIVRDAPRTPPTVGIFDNPLRCYKVNQEWAMHVMGAASTLDAWKAWTGDEDGRNEAAQSIMEFLVGEVCSLFKLRQSPTEPCLLEQSLDAGETWLPAFDYSLCGAGGSTMSASIYIDIAITQIEEYNTAYIAASSIIINVYPGLEYDASGDDDHRDTALCYALRSLLNSIFDAAEIAAQEELNSSRFFTHLVNWTANAFGLVDEVLLGSLVRSISRIIFGTASLEDAIDALGNSNARDLVVCCLYGNMEGVDPEYIVWNDAGDACGFTGGSDEALLLSVLEPLFDDLDTYLSFMAILASAFTLAENGLISNNCDPCGINFRADFDGEPDDLPHTFAGASHGSVEDEHPYSGVYGVKESNYPGTGRRIEFWLDLPSVMNVSQVEFRFWQQGTGTALTANVTLWDGAVQQDSYSLSGSYALDEWHHMVAPLSGNGDRVKIYTAELGQIRDLYVDAVIVTAN